MQSKYYFKNNYDLIIYSEKIWSCIYLSKLNIIFMYSLHNILHYLNCLLKIILRFMYVNYVIYNIM